MGNPSRQPRLIDDELTGLGPGFFEAQTTAMNAAGLLLRNEHGQILLVKPLYRTTWQLPGGLAEGGESPRQAARREAREELALDVEVGRLLSVDYKSATAQRPACVQFVFDGGHLPAVQFANLRLRAGEIEAWRAVELDDAPDLVEGGGPMSRLVHTIQALRTGGTVYLEDGHHPVTYPSGQFG